MATENIFAGTITCTGMTVNGAVIVTGAIASTVGFVGPSLTAISAGAVAGTAGNTVFMSATNGVANTGGAGGGGGAGSLFAGNGANGSTTGGAGSVYIYVITCKFRLFPFCYFLSKNSLDRHTVEMLPCSTLSSRPC